MILCSVVNTMNLYSFVVLCLCRWAGDIVIVNVDEVVKNQWTGGTFFTLILKINILILFTVLKYFNFLGNICKLEPF